MPDTHPALLEICTTVATHDDALRLAHLMVNQGLAACVQIDAITSVYRWQGAVHQEPEHRLTLKTTASHWPAVEAALKAAHPYELPAIYAVAVSEASAAYAEWVAASCT
jgi:periplasmic divalent cation tolerance protein